MSEVKEYITITDDIYHYASGYFTMNKWTNNGDLVLLRSKYENMKFPNELVYYSVSEQKVKEILCTNISGGLSGGYLVYNDIVYILTQGKLIALDLNTKEERTVYTVRKGDSWTMPHITSDGRYISLHSRVESKGKFISIDTQSGEVNISFEKKFLPPFSTANHGMICPANPDIMFFAHEGNTQYITNRLWIYNKKTGQMRNITKQKMDENSNLVEFFGHETWAPDGKGMYFVKYPQSPLKPTGLGYVDMETGENEILFSGYPYWHVSVSKDGKHLSADTMRGCFDGTDLSEVVVADIAERTETVIDVVHSTGKHPCHPHPHFSLDSKMLVYTIRTETDRTTIKIAILK